MKRNRQPGSTSRQMIAAPKDAVFVWLNADLRYPTKLAQALGRQDLKIVSPDWLTQQRWRGLRLSAIIMDYGIPRNAGCWSSFGSALTRVVREADCDRLSD